MNTITKKLVAALRDCRTLAYNCYRDELPSAIITTASKAIAEYNAQRAAPKDVVLRAAKTISYGPRAEPYDDGIVVSVKRAEDADFWAVYEWRPSQHALEDGWWEWLADCDTEATARTLAEALTRGA